MELTSKEHKVFLVFLRELRVFVVNFQRGLVIACRERKMAIFMTAQWQARPDAVDQVKEALGTFVAAVAQNELHDSIKSQSL